MKSFDKSTVVMQTHTQTYLHYLKSIDFLKIDPRVYLSNLHYWVIHMEDIHWFQNLSINKENTETKAPKQQQVLASYIQYVSICIVMAIHVYIYNGYKNLSTYLSYTAEFLQAQELSDPLKPLKMVQLHLPGMFACEKLWQINSGHADTHTNVSTLFKIYKYFFK